MAGKKQLVVVYDLKEPFTDMDGDVFKALCRGLGILIEERISSGCRIYKMPEPISNEDDLMSTAEFKGRLTGKEKFTDN